MRRIIADAPRLLVAGGWLALELGGDQDEVLSAELVGAGFSELTSWHDEDRAKSLLSLLMVRVLLLDYLGRFNLGNNLGW